MERSAVVGMQLAALAAHLASRRGDLLKAWRASVEADPEIHASRTLPRRQFVDHIPAVLDALEERLRSGPRPESVSARRSRKEDSAVHGLVRWQQGYDLREVTREWGHLALCLAEELEVYARERADLDPGVLPFARRALAETWNDGVSESTAQYFELQQVEVEGQLRDLEALLTQAQEQERRRAELWRQAAHDLRGNVGVVMTASGGLGLEGLPESMRGRFVQSLQRSVSSLHSMLDEVTELSRLQAGHERAEIRPFDAAALLTELCDGLRSNADTRGLFLNAEGPAELQVEGDPGKLRRIAQNLILNAIKYTETGGVTVTWAYGQAPDVDRWRLCVRDTGPGFHAGPGAPLAGALQDATEESRRDESPGTGPSPAPTPAAAGPPDARLVHQERGEGVGLSIVKRLCEMLDATVTLDSRRDEGTTACVFLPRRYD
jgi:signal transduction histidine kinase